MELLHQAVVDVVEVIPLDAAEVIRFYAGGLVGDTAGIVDGVDVKALAGVKDNVRGKELAGKSIGLLVQYG